MGLCTGGSHTDKREVGSEGSLRGEAGLASRAGHKGLGLWLGQSRWGQPGEGAHLLDRDPGGQKCLLTQLGGPLVQLLLGL